MQKSKRKVLFSRAKNNKNNQKKTESTYCTCAMAVTSQLKGFSYIHLTAFLTGLQNFVNICLCRKTNLPS